jgi:hypothetical protein
MTRLVYSHTAKNTLDALEVNERAEIRSVMQRVMWAMSADEPMPFPVTNLGGEPETFVLNLRSGDRVFYRINPIEQSIVVIDVLTPSQLELLG